MIQAIAHTAALLMGLATFILWIDAIMEWDGEPHCDESERDTCPFPRCEKCKKIQGGTRV